MKQLKGYYAGINFGGWYSQCDYSLDRYNNFIKEEDFAKVASWGFDHVRIPVDYNLFMDNEGNFIESGFNRIEQAIGYCRKYGLNMVLDLHKTVGFSFDKGENEAGFFEDEHYQNLFYSLWEQLTKHFVKDEDIVAFELLNEVTEQRFMPAWNRIATNVIKLIRSYSKTVKILVGGYANNSALAVSSIDIPVDENIVYNFHCYSPLLFTHQGAYWIDKMDTNFRTTYKQTYGQYVEGMKGVLDFAIHEMTPFKQDEVVGEYFFEKMFEEAIKAAEEKDVYLYCGEYGVIELADTKDLLEWFKDIHAVFTKHGIGHALWSYREMDFDFVGDRLNEIRDELIDSSKK